MRRKSEAGTDLKVEAKHEPDPKLCLRALLLALDLEPDSEDDDEPEISSDLVC
ncbi:MAG: hypothetical protein M3362_20740 [Acidobacteriota bacterium]|nr:hypothetical protein [Acidobacteriota bacterium]